MKKLAPQNGKTEAADVFRVVLPWPPSINGMYRAGKRRVYMADTGAEWYELAILHITWAAGFRYHRYPVGSKIRVSHALVPPTAHALDLDNRDKAINDALQKAKLVANDVQIYAGDRIKFDKQPKGVHAGAYIWVSRLPDNFGVTFDPLDPMNGLV